MRFATRLVALICLFLLLSGCATTVAYTGVDEQPVTVTCPLCKTQAKAHNDMAAKINANNRAIMQKRQLKAQYHAMAKGIRTKILQVRNNSALTKSEQDAIINPAYDLINKYEKKAADVGWDARTLAWKVGDQRKKLAVLKQLFDNCEANTCKAAEAAGTPNLALMDTLCKVCNTELKAINDLIKKRDIVRHKIHAKAREENSIKSSMTRVRNRIRVERSKALPSPRLIEGLKRQLSGTQSKLAKAGQQRAAVEAQLKALGARLADALEKWRKCEKSRCRTH